VEVDRWAAMRRPERHSLEIVACCRSPAARDAKPPRGDLSLPPTSALVEYRSTSRPSASGATHLLAVALTPDGPPRLVDLGEAARSPICNGAWSG